MANLAYMPVSKLTELLRAADVQGEMYVVLRDNQLALGNDPLKPTSLVDFPSEAIRALSGSVREHLAASPLRILRRRSGDYWFEIQGRRTNCGSLKELLSESLKAFEGIQTGTLEKLSRVKGRSRHIVAREPGPLYPKAHLAEKYAERLIPGWWYGTNNSAEQTLVWLRRACSLAGLTWGEDFRTNLGS